MQAHQQISCWGRWMSIVWMAVALPAVAVEPPPAGEGPRLLTPPGDMQFGYQHPSQEILLRLDWPGGEVDQLEAVAESPWIRIGAQEGFREITSTPNLNLHVRLMLDQLSPGTHTGQVAVLYPVDGVLERLEIPLVVTRSLPVAASPSVLKVMETGRPLSPALTLYSLDKEPMEVLSVEAPSWLILTPLTNGPAVRVGFSMSMRQDVDPARVAAETHLVFLTSHPGSPRLEVPIQIIQEIELLRQSEARRRNVPVSRLADWTPPTKSPKDETPQ